MDELAGLSALLMLFLLYLWRLSSLELFEHTHSNLCVHKLIHGKRFSQPMPEIANFPAQCPLPTCLYLTGQSHREFPDSTVWKP